MATTSLGSITLNAATSNETVDAYEIDNSIISFDESHSIKMEVNLYILNRVTEHISFLALQNFSMNAVPSRLAKIHNLQLDCESSLHISAQEIHRTPSSLSHISMINIPTMSLSMSPSITLHKGERIQHSGSSMNISATITVKPEPIKIFRYNLIEPVIKINVSRMTDES